MNLTDKIAIVTGAGQGIGKAIALRLANAGADVAIMDLNMAAAETVAQEIEGIGRKALPVQADVSQSDDVNAAVEKVISTFSRVDILVNNAGIAGRTLPLTDLEETDWDTVISVNLTGVFLCCKAVIAPMIAQVRGEKVATGGSLLQEEFPYSISNLHRQYG